MLQNYALTHGHCQSLAKSLGLLDSSKVNRILLNNCGITGKDFAHILEGLNHLQDFKSLVYKANGFTQETLEALRPFLYRRVPYHLEELRLIDLKIT